MRAPYDNNPPVTDGWIAQYLCNRFDRIPSDIALRVQDSTGVWQLRGYADRRGLFDQSQSVLT